MKRNIAIVAGGDSSEIVISLKSAEGIFSFLDKDKYNVYIAIVKRDEWAVKLPGGEHTPIDKNDFSFRENGEIRHFDFGMFVSALTFNKFACNHYLKGFGVDIAHSIHLFKGQTVTDEEVVSRLGLPVFVKPNDGGSSFGVTKVKEASAIQPAIDKAFSEGREVVIESFIDGTEVTCGCYKTADKEVVFPLTEVVTDNEFFDFDAKYNGQVQEITPARISAEQTEKVQRETSRIYDILGAKGLIRVDYIIPADGEPKLLEVNTTPGMTATSFIPQQVRAAGLEMKDVMTDIIENEFN